jgi:hypothetical protein
MISYRGCRVVEVPPRADLPKIYSGLAESLAERFDSVTIESDGVTARVGLWAFVHRPQNLRGGWHNYHPMLPFSSVDVRLQLRNSEATVTYKLGLQAQIIIVVGLCVAASLQGWLAHGWKSGLLIGLGISSALFVLGWMRWRSDAPEWIAASVRRAAIKQV